MQPAKQWKSWADVTLCVKAGRLGRRFRCAIRRARDSHISVLVTPSDRERLTDQQRLLEPTSIHHQRSPDVTVRTVYSLVYNCIEGTHGRFTFSLRASPHCMMLYTVWHIGFFKTYGCVSACWQGRRTDVWSFDGTTTGGECLLTGEHTLSSVATVLHMIRFVVLNS